YSNYKKFGFCQTGTSLALLSDGTTLLGSPGPYTWRGTLFVISLGVDFLSRNHDVFVGPLNDTPEPIDKYSYLGMSVTAGRFFREHPLSYAGGAPRSKDYGQVYILNTLKNQLQMNISLVLDGEQIASSFGYEILAADVNNDGFDDLFVGAPFYFSRTKGGAVYIYHNLRNCTTTTDCKSDLVLKGTLESRFGFSMASLGDINRDGYTDIAIGAPYEGNGAIYIYLGSKDGLIPQHSQKIHPEWTGVKTLGYSLSGGVDIDNNGYPDLLSGAFESDAALLFRARPIIDIETSIEGKELKNIDMSKTGCRKEPDSSNTCLSFRSCFKINAAEAKTSLNGVVVRYAIEAETFEKKFSRVWFKNPDPNIRHSYKVEHITLNERKKGHCSEETVYIKENTRDILSPIKFRVNYTLANHEPHSAILNQTSVKNFEATFQKDCGSDDICQSKLILNAALLLKEMNETEYLLNLGGLDEFILEANVSNLGESAYEAQLYVMHPISLSYISLADKSGNIKCTLKNDTVVVCNLGNPFPTNKNVNLRLRFETKPLINKENELKFNIIVNSTSEELSDQTTASLTAIIRKKAELKIISAATSYVMYGGEVKGESAMKYFDDIGSRVWHTYQVVNDGPWRVTDLEVDIQWPWQVANDKVQGKWLLYLEDIPQIEGKEKDYCFVTPSQGVNVLNLTNRFESGEDSPPDNLLAPPSFNQTGLVSSLAFLPPARRRKRDVEYVVKPITVTGKDGKKRQIVAMDCNRMTAKCITIKCYIAQIDKGEEATIRIKSRLWNSTLVEDYSKVDWVTISSHAELKIPDSTIEQDNWLDDSAMAETLAYPDLLIQSDTGVPLWVIIAAVVTGLLLLLIVIFVLWKIGFFKRKRISDPTLSGNLTKQNEQETLLNK
ncbi:integrin alpha-PS1-like, partial [Agrilus planipennis]|uniref:Integrin alpha-PS1-like n=1 Tax=Agrilus planipennis TaxID=224129 RepID=A0A1W4WG02_AGRPL